MARVAALAVCLLFAVSCGKSEPQKPGPGAPPSGGNTPAPKDLTVVAGYVGGEKMHLLGNPNVKRLLAQKYGIRIDATKAGSVEMVTTLSLRGKDFVWPSNDIAVEFFRMQGRSMKKDQIVFSSPIVIYTGWNIANALIERGIVEKRGDSMYVVKFPELLDLIVAKKTWKDLGLDQLYGHVSVRCTDPTRSNSGNMFAGLVANMMNGGQVVDDKTVEPILPRIDAFFARLGMMEHSSGDIFRKFLTTGVNNSMVVGYENQIVEFVLSHPNARSKILDSVCVLYPVPTVWSSHPVISLNDKGSKLIEAMMDPALQDVAWSDHGFRSGLIGITQNPADVGVLFMPENLDSVIPLPTAKAMDRIVKQLRE